MFWIIFSIVVSLIVLTAFTIKNLKYIKEEIAEDGFRTWLSNISFVYFMIFMIVCLFSAVCFVFTSLGCSNSENIPKSYETYKTTNIVALKDNSTENSQCYLLGQYKNQSLYYTYMMETKNGFIADEISSKRCYLKYDSENPRIEVAKGCFEDDFMKFFAMPIGISDRVTIYYPEGTISTEFNIDLE